MACNRINRSSAANDTRAESILQFMLALLEVCPGFGSAVCLPGMSKLRLDALVVERGLAESRSQAQRVIRAGEVLVAGQVADKPGTRILSSAQVTLQNRPRFVSRGGEKLDAALSGFGLDVRGWMAADVGASTGGFTDCLLQRGASRVFAIDVGYGQLDWGLRNDPRVVVVERTNARYLNSLPGPVALATIDVSFISLDLILPRAIGWLRAGSDTAGQGSSIELSARDTKHIVALVKPQFEAGRREVRKGGVVRDPAVHRRVLRSVLESAGLLGLGLCGLMASPLRGPAGNVEFLVWWDLDQPRIDPSQAINACLPEEDST